MQGTLMQKGKYDLNEMLRKLVKEGVSDIHLKAGKQPMIRIDGILDPVKGFPVLTTDDSYALACQIFRGSQKEEYDSGIAIDTSYQLEGICRFRVNIYRQRRSAVIAFRIIPMRIPDFEELHLPPVLKKIAMEPRGLILVTGVTGSGKSTTLACILNHLAKQKKIHIITIEDPIEFLYTDSVASISQIEIGYDSPSFEDAIRASIRQDPDIILVGEMRDLETVRTAIKAAEMGYLIFSTVHTTDAPKTINRILDLYPAHQQQQVRYQLADSLKAVISMRLLPHASGKGRYPAMEVMIRTSTIADYIQDPKKTDSIKDVIDAGKTQYGMFTFDQHLSELYKSGILTLQTAMEASSSPADFQRALIYE
jgi:twitching motility protein PilT